jgi:hypothetical protein
MSMGGQPSKLKSPGSLPGHSSGPMGRNEPQIFQSMDNQRSPNTLLHSKGTDQVRRSQAVVKTPASMKSQGKVPPTQNTLNYRDIIGA